MLKDATISFSQKYLYLTTFGKTTTFIKFSANFKTLKNTTYLINESFVVFTFLSKLIPNQEFDYKGCI